MKHGQRRALAGCTQNERERIGRHDAPVGVPRAIAGGGEVCRPRAIFAGT